MLLSKIWKGLWKRVLYSEQGTFLILLLEGKTIVEFKDKSYYWKVEKKKWTYIFWPFGKPFIEQFKWPKSIVT